MTIEKQMLLSWKASLKFPVGVEKKTSLPKVIWEEGRGHPDPIRVFPQCTGQIDVRTVAPKDPPTDRPRESLTTIGRCATRATRPNNTTLLSTKIIKIGWWVWKVKQSKAASFSRHGIQYDWQEALLLQRNRATRYVSWNIMGVFWLSYWQEALLIQRNHANTLSVEIV